MCTTWRIPVATMCHLKRKKYAPKWFQKASDHPRKCRYSSRKQVFVDPLILCDSAEKMIPNWQILVVFLLFFEGRKCEAFNEAFCYRADAMAYGPPPYDPENAPGALILNKHPNAYI